MANDSGCHQLPEVFEATHSLIFRMYGDGWIDRVCIDHVDGLADPAGYCQTLHARLTQLAAQRPEYVPLHRPYLIIEKILDDAEALRSDWRVDGTTGYDFMSDVCAVLHDARGEEPLTRLWEGVSTGDVTENAATGGGGTGDGQTGRAMSGGNASTDVAAGDTPCPAPARRMATCLGTTSPGTAVWKRNYARPGGK